MALAFHYATTTGAGVKNGAAWATAFDLAAFMTHWGAGPAAGDVFVFEAGTYTLTADITTTADGTSTDPIAIVGVAAGTTHEGDAITGTDFPTGTNRPYFDANGSAYGIVLDDYTWVMNICLDSSDTTPLRADAGSVIRNCKVLSEYTGASIAYGIYSGGVGWVIDCEATGAETTGGQIFLSTPGSNALFCYVHDCTEAGTAGFVTGGGSAISIIFCIMDCCITGILKTAEHGGCIFGCTLYDCDTGISGTTDYATAIINNIFSECDTDDIIWTTADIKCNVFMYNHSYNYNDRYDGVIADGDANDLFCDFWDTGGVAAGDDPDFTTPGSDFSLQSTSPCIDAGMVMRLGVG
jgi:hypothetical protein